MLLKDIRERDWNVDIREQSLLLGQIVNFKAETRKKLGKSRRVV